MGWWSELRRNETEEWYFGPVEEATSPNRKAETIIAERQYISVYLRALHISHTRVGRQRIYGTVTSSCSVTTRSGKRAESLIVTTPTVLRDVDATNLDRVVTGTTRLLGPVPYRGGGVELELGLFTAPGQDLLGPYLQLLEQAAGLASVGLIGQNSGLIALVKDGLNAVFGGRSGPELEIGLSHVFEKPISSHFAVIRAPSASISRPPVLANDQRLRWPDNSMVSEPYLVFGINADSRREDWASIPYLHEAYEQVRSAATSGDLPGARGTLAHFRRVATFSPDLLPSDGVRLFKLVERQIALAFPSTATAADSQASFPAFEDLPF